MQSESRPTPRELVAVEGVLLLGLERLREQLVAGGALRVAPTREAWEEVRGAVEAHLAAIREPDGGVVYLPRRPREEPTR